MPAIRLVFQRVRLQNVTHPSEAVLARLSTWNTEGDAMIFSVTRAAS